MAEVVQEFQGPGSRWKLVWDALRGRQPAAAVDSSVSFAELVWAHHKRQKEVFAGVREGPWENEYRRRLKLFTAEHGRIIESYWCRYEASGVALTEKQLGRRLWNFFRSDSILGIHTATDWRTANAPVVAWWLHQWETAGIKASEVLRETSERIALHWIFAASSRLLGFADQKPNTQATDDDSLASILAHQDDELKQVNDYYARAGENSARIVYFRGMIWGTAALAGIVGGSLLLAWWLDLIDPHEERTYTLFASIGMGGAGAILSVMTRMGRSHGFNLDFEVGRKSVRYLGGLRPWIGALFAFALYLALKSNLVELVQSADHGIYFFATVAFLAGFSERRAKVLLDSAMGGGSGPDGENGNTPPGQGGVTA
jgi:hypothetical protein